MKAVLIKGGKSDSPESLYIGEAPRPQIKPTEVLCSVKAFGLNRAEVSQRKGSYPIPPGATTILGLEFSGIVEEVGNEAGEWKKGEEVFGLVSGGSYAEYVACSHLNLLKKPTQLSWTDAASIPENYLTAFKALFLVADFKAGQRVLIHAAASGVGLALIQLAAHHGAKQILATAGSEEKLEFVKTLGATNTFNYKTTDWSKGVLEATNNEGVDVVIDFVGAEYFNKNLQAIARDGRMVMLGALGGLMASNVNLGPLLHKRIRVEGSNLRSRSVAYQGELVGKFAEVALPELFKGEKNGGYRLVTKIHPLSELVQAVKDMEANANTGKLVISADWSSVQAS